MDSVPEADMTSAHTYPLAPDYELAIERPWEVPAAIVSRVNEIWEREKAQRAGRLTNGRIYGLAEFGPDFLRIYPTEYRYVLARRRVPDLVQDGLCIRPLAVTGVLICADGLVLGRRGASVAGDNGLWEPAPSGGLSNPDPRVQVFEELEEELGIARDAIMSAEACGLIEDAETGVFDIIFRLETAATGQEVRTAHASRGSDEYDALAIVRSSEIAAFLNAQESSLLPSLRSMLRVAHVNSVRKRAN